MKRIILATLLALAFLVVGAPSCQPTATISAKGPSSAYCGAVVRLTGTVNPASATSSVTLQRYKNGAWADHLGYHNYETPELSKGPHRLTTSVNRTTGVYALDVAASYLEGPVTMRWRVRSAGGGVTSPSVYVKLIDLEADDLCGDG